MAGATPDHAGSGDEGWPSGVRPGYRHPGRRPGLPHAGSQILTLTGTRTRQPSSPGRSDRTCPASRALSSTIRIRRPASTLRYAAARQLICLRFGQPLTAPSDRATWCVRSSLGRRRGRMFARIRRCDAGCYGGVSRSIEAPAGFSSPRAPLRVRGLARTFRGLSFRRGRVAGTRSASRCWRKGGPRFAAATGPRPGQPGQMRHEPVARRCLARRWRSARVAKGAGGSRSCIYRGRTSPLISASAARAW